MSGLLFPFLPGGDAAEISVVGEAAVSTWVVNDAVVSITETSTIPGGRVKWGPATHRPRPKAPPQPKAKPRKPIYVVGDPAISEWHVNEARVELGDPYDDYAQDLVAIMAALS